MKIHSLKGKKVLVLGATSAIAQASCESLAQQGASLYLASRNLSALERIANQLRIRYDVNITCDFFDAEETDSHLQFFNRVLKKTGNLDGLLLAFGYLGNGEDETFAQQEIILKRNLIGAISILTLIANHFEQSKKGFIIAISSIAGDRGRRKHYAYSSAKSALTTYLQGLRNRLYKSGIRVITVKPGFVDTPMTKNLSGLLMVAKAEIVGQRIIRQLSLSSDVIYVPWFWRYLMLIVKAIPESIFKRISW